MRSSIFRHNIQVKSDILKSRFREYGIILRRLGGVRTVRVMVVERSPFLRLVFREVLARANCEMVGECDGLNEAVGLAGNLEPDVILLDLEGDHGEWLRGITGLRRISPLSRLIVMGPPGQPAIEGKDVAAYLSKPCSPEAVLAAISQSRAIPGVVSA